MRAPQQVLERNLTRATARARGLQLLDRSCSLGSILCLVLLALVGVGHTLWTPSPVVGGVLVGLVVLVGLLAWLLLLVVTLSQTPERSGLARMLEQGQPELLDRVHTLVHLERGKHRPAIAPFYRRILAQAASVLARSPPGLPGATSHSLGWLAAFVAALLATVFLYQRHPPWARWVPRTPPNLPAAGLPPETPPPLALPEDQAVELKQSWGEVRVSTPGRDLKVTKVDVVPLQIEAAANEPLRAVSWATAINGANETMHPLPPPADPSYAVYQPVLYLDEFQLSDWDVLAYYARAETRNTNQFISDLYFLEVRPFREDIQKLPGGESGAAAKCLNELSELIGRQKQVIRDTLRHQQTPPPEAAQAQTERQGLATAETDLAKATDQLHSRLLADFENADIRETLEHLTKAGRELERAGGSLSKNALPRAQNEERSALADLVAARKGFHKAVSDHPDSFQGEPEEDLPPVAASLKRLKDIAEFRNEAKAAQEFLERATTRQRDIARRAGAGANNPSVTSDQEQLASGFDDFKNQHPRVFRPLEAEVAKTQEALKDALAAVRQGPPRSGAAAGRAAEELHRLTEAVAERSAGHQVADAYRLKETLEQLIRQLEQLEQNPAATNRQQLEDLLSAGQLAAQQLQQNAERPGNRRPGAAASRAVEGAQPRELEQALESLGRAPGDYSRKHAAAFAKSKFEQARDALARRLGQDGAARGPTGESAAPSQEQFERGIAELESLLARREHNRPSPPKDTAKQTREALANMRSALAQRPDASPEAVALVERLEAALKPGENPPLDPVALRKLLAELQAYSFSAVEAGPAKDLTPAATHVDAARVPPAYRERVQSYFRRLSEK